MIQKKEGCIEEDIELNIKMRPDNIELITMNRPDNIFMNDNGLSSAIPSSVTSTTRLKTIINNIFVNCEVKSAGTYVSVTSYHEPLWLNC
ncbi:hypothetical protein A0J61_09156 [Choanephora cucurbitarum]|uniref:Uncharacterized protein n=1 Tax=Choanephora cucurbitarum TaxID=101091 RepID=A0A1C7N627_9FUNG|nr:hypothetical protein A0J61_09156 [Choanephora cucurbitarum]